MKIWLAKVPQPDPDHWTFFMISFAAKATSIWYPTWRQVATMWNTDDYFNAAGDVLQIF